MRRSPTQLVLVGTLPLALTACGGSDDEPNFSAQTTFASVQECANAKVPVDFCSEAYMKALAEHLRIAPTYDDQASCEADFVPDYCQATSDGKYMPKVGGFQLSFEGNVPKDVLQQTNQQLVQSNPGASSNFLTGLLIGNLLSNGFGSRYATQPVYMNRDDRGGYYSSTLYSQIDRGKTYSRSTQARYSPDKTYSKTTLARSLGAGSSVSSTVSRGGFGSQATARSGWGGKSSSRSSFGG
ncbi:DUF1190 domain-containing protein [Pseudomonas sp. DTU_2021_1001937_2_SI_NGA_ILE_001]|uniref:DUF1190 domain-containing protein n=1 Tax=Pseudomonas sp. DTU_2021_1001937_2_SI_NGA_ILE_001 TaxID=3077589 RepID=UPI0025D372CC|nr:DUF1190 domain-containing protein [Pseudomonas sp. DTU_2021_1001937_2_SI_NGA_ILE_001]WNW14150.1 DUF1190 domain-containing protein [Pseudomonas sp. DTU_2021_1001937_2_SI_NGA_ILE_001]